MLVLLFSSDGDLVEDVSDWCRYFGVKLVVSQNPRGWQAALDPLDVIVVDAETVPVEQFEQMYKEMNVKPRTIVLFEPTRTPPLQLFEEWVVWQKPVGLRDFRKLLELG